MDIALSSDALDLAIHPTSDLVAVGLISGKVQLLDLSHSFENQPEGQEKKRRKKVDEDGSDKRPQHQRKWNVRVRNKSCRAVEFDRGKQTLLWAVETSKILIRYVPHVHRGGQTLVSQ